MKKLVGVILFLAVSIGLYSGCKAGAGMEYPYARAGLTQNQAAEHLLSRFTYGARAGEVEKVVQQGLEVWLERQLIGENQETRLEGLLADTPATLSTAEIVRRYPTRYQLVTAARRSGVITRDQNVNTPEAKQAIDAFAAAQGIRPLEELVDALYRQKLLRAIYAENQLREVLTEFWFNHFNVAVQDAEARPRLLVYERETLRPRALGKFGELLSATAKSPAMLHYLDNANNRVMKNPLGGTKGSNENYARELLELHTIGLGEYAQNDVEETARVFTGWGVATYHPLDKDPGDAGSNDEGFVFRPAQHDKGEKTILNERVLPSGVPEGERVLARLAEHPATARRIATKLAVRFVSDAPSPSLINRLAEVFQASRGDTKAVIRALVGSTEFWAASKKNRKVKNPLELTVSALRATGVEVKDAKGLLNWLSIMGMPLYGSQLPTGWPDRAEDWITSGTMFGRLNFRIALAAGKVAGIGAPTAVAPDGGSWNRFLTSPEFELR